MMTKESALEIREAALTAVRSLSHVVSISQNACSKADAEKIKKGAGLAIGQIQTEILSVVNAAYPDLDDLQ